VPIEFQLRRLRNSQPHCRFAARELIHNHLTETSSRDAVDDVQALAVSHHCDVVEDRNVLIALSFSCPFFDKLLSHEPGQMVQLPVLDPKRT
jgi:hypothetical protein